MTSPTTPRDDIAGLSERLRAWSPMIASGYECPAASTAMYEAATALDALQARVKELEAEIPQLLTEQRRKLCAEHDKDITELKRVRRVAKEAIEAAESRALRAEQERDTELQTLNDNGIGSHIEAVVLVVDLRRQLALAQQERDEAYERAAVAAESKYADVAYNAFLRAAGRVIAAAIRSLAAGTEKGER